MEPSEGFPPVSRGDARILVLGSLPGQKSLQVNQYYAHPRNAFWRIMFDLFDIRGDYESRCVGLTESGIALWDVLQASIRPGSLDASIQTRSAKMNDFDTFFQRHQKVELIVFNGKKAESLFRRFSRDARFAVPPTAALPSTSPAYAAMPYSGKLDAWRRAMRIIRN